MTRVSRHRVLALSLLLLGGCGTATAGPPRLAVSGQVVDAAGAPVPGAVVSDGVASALSDDAGRFSLGIYTEAVAALKPGYRRTETRVAQATALKLRLAEAPAAVRVGFDSRSSARLSGLRGSLAEAGVEVADYPQRGLGQLDVLLLVTPAVLPGAERERLRAWVRAGGRLIVCGEWGGFPAQDLDGLNALAGDAGIRFTGATVKTAQPAGGNEEWFTIAGPAPSALAAQVGSAGLFLFTCTSLSLSGGARPLLQSSRDAYGVLAATGPQTLGAVGPAGYGKVLALGDSSLWLDEDSAGVGVPNWQRGANRALAAALMAW